jgi:Rieske Fe-S protein
MVGGLVGGYGACGLVGARYLYPAGDRPRSWQYVTEVRRMKPGDSMTYTAPSGEKVAIARMGESGEAEDFIALSSSCPHLGCQVHWEPQNDRFFCPCHNGVFSPEGAAVSGPPADAQTNLPEFALKVENGLLFIDLPMDTGAA